MRKIESSLRSREKSSSLLFSSSLSISCFRSSDQEPGREASERGTKLLAPELLSSSFEGRVHAPGRGTKDGFAAFDALLGGRRGTEDVFSGSSFSYQTLDPKPQTRSSPSTNHYSLITSHRSYVREAELARRSRTGRRRRLASRSDTGLRKQTGGTFFRSFGVIELNMLSIISFFEAKNRFIVPLLPDQLFISEQVRKYCEANRCGKYGANLMCPPFVQAVEQFREELGLYDRGFLVIEKQMVEDIYDMEEASAGARYLHETMLEIEEKLQRVSDSVRVLVGGSCQICKRCAALDGESKCRFPDRSRVSLEALGVDLYGTATNIGYKLPYEKNAILWSGLALYSFRRP